MVISTAKVGSVSSHTARLLPKLLRQRVDFVRRYPFLATVYRDSADPRARWSPWVSRAALTADEAAEWIRAGAKAAEGAF